MQPVADEKALIIDEYLVVADLHLGLERELAMAGARVPSQLERIERRISKLLKKTGKESLIILGDLKHSIPGFSWQEQREIPAFIQRLSSRADLVLVKGNHDGGIEKLVPGVRVVMELRAGEALLIHGHAKPREKGYKTLITAHNHPCIEFRGELGGRITESAWIRARFREEYGGETNPEVMVMPAFNDLIYGMPFNYRSNRQLLGPLFRQDMVDLDAADAYLIDGTYLGKIRDLREAPHKESH